MKKQQKKKRKHGSDLSELGPDVDEMTCKALGGVMKNGKCIVVRKRIPGRPSKINSHLKFKR